MLDKLLNTDWKIILKNEITQAYFSNLSTFIENEYSKHQCFPVKERIFAALNNCLFTDIKVVIIGQEPYYKPHFANGLSFSVNSGMPIPVSLQNIFKEIENDLNIEIPNNGNLTKWAKQGVLLLNGTLSVRVHKGGSHKKQGWEQFTDAVISKISEHKKGVVFILWGDYAKEKGKDINREKHLVLESEHPSLNNPNRGIWFGNKHFSKCNHYFKKSNQKIIEW